MCPVNLISEFVLYFTTTHLRKKDDSVKGRINTKRVSKKRTKSSYNANILLEDMILNTTCKL